MNSGSRHRTEDVRILKGDALETEDILRIALRCSLIDDYRWRGRMIALMMEGTTLELPEHDARVFLWGLVRGRERTLAQLRR